MQAFSLYAFGRCRVCGCPLLLSDDELESHLASGNDPRLICYPCDQRTGDSPRRARPER